MGLFGPAYKSKNEEKALKALENVRDTGTLLGIAGDPTVLKSVRTAAIRKIEDQDLLFKIAADKALDTETRKAAISAFTEETRIKYITGVFHREGWKPYTMGGGTYARELKNAYALGPEDPENRSPFGIYRGSIHQPDESTSIKLLMDTAKMYARLLVNLDDIKF